MIRGQFLSDTAGGGSDEHIPQGDIVRSYKSQIVRLREMIPTQYEYNETTLKALAEIENKDPLLVAKLVKELYPKGFHAYDITSASDYEKRENALVSTVAKALDNDRITFSQAIDVIDLARRHQSTSAEWILRRASQGVSFTEQDCFLDVCDLYSERGVTYKLATEVASKTGYRSDAESLAYVFDVLSNTADKCQSIDSYYPFPISDVVEGIDGFIKRGHFANWGSAINHLVGGTSTARHLIAELSPRSRELNGYPSSL